MLLTVALVGDYNPAVTAHRAIPLALELAGRNLGLRVEGRWVPTVDLTPSTSPLDGAAAAWCVPASPYASTAGALAAIRRARLEGLPFLGTCGGFQHLILEYAAAEWKLDSVAHAELEPEAANPVIAPLACALVEQQGEIRLQADSRTARAYGSAAVVEGYHCRYGLNPRYADRLTAGPLRAKGWDASGEVRVVELDDHPFFVGTLFQPERAALAGRVPPLVTALLKAAARPAPAIHSAIHSSPS